MMPLSPLGGRERRGSVPKPDRFGRLESPGQIP